MKQLIVALFIGLFTIFANAQVSTVLSIDGETFSYNARNLTNMYDAVLKKPSKISSAALRAIADSYYVGKMYFDRMQTAETCEQNFNKAFKLYTLLSQGNYEPEDIYHAQMRLGTMYIQGLGIPKDTKKGFAKYMGAATEGNTSAQIFLGMSYLTGEYTNQDFQQANFWLTKAAEPTDGGRESSRNGYACYILGCAYYEGNSLASGKIDYDRAVEYLSVNLRYLQRYYRDILDGNDEEEKAELADVCRKLQACYRFGRGVEQDVEWADVLLKTAAELGDLKAKTLIDYINEKPTLY